MWFYLAIQGTCPHYFKIHHGHLWLRKRISHHLPGQGATPVSASCILYCICSLCSVPPLFIYLLFTPLCRSLTLDQKRSHLGSIRSWMWASYNQLLCRSMNTTMVNTVTVRHSETKCMLVLSVTHKHTHVKSGRVDKMTLHFQDIQYTFSNVLQSSRYVFLIAETHCMKFYHPERRAGQLLRLCRGDVCICAEGKQDDV